MEEKRKLPGRTKDLTGQRFGKLTVLEPTPERADGGSVVWKCVCDCGKETAVSAARLTKGRVKSCGCIAEEKARNLTGETFGRLTVLGPAEKRQGISENFWNCRCSCGRETVVGQTELLNGSTVSCGCYRNERVKESLRLVDGTSITLLEKKKGKVRGDNKSGYPGVMEEKNGRWRAVITFRKKQYWLGRFNTREEAVEARKKAEEMQEQFLEWYYEQHENKEKKTEN